MDFINFNCYYSGVRLPDTRFVITRIKLGGVPCWDTTDLQTIGKKRQLSKYKI